LVAFGNLVFGQTSGYSIGILGAYGAGILRGPFGSSGKVESHNFSYSNDQTKRVMASLGKGYDLQVDMLK